MTALLPNVDPEGLLEYSVVFTDRALNHMSEAFQEVMRDISATLRRAYNAESVAVIPGGGTYAMAAVARQLATDAKVVVLRNGGIYGTDEHTTDTQSLMRITNA